MNSSQPDNPPYDLLNEVQLLDTPGAEILRLKFSGPFEGREVHWNATLHTPEAWAHAFDESRPTQNIIEIRESDGDNLALNICLKVKSIDRPTIRKTVMMIRQYRHLARGRHQYG